jgi:hypothetical protein
MPPPSPSPILHHYASAPFSAKGRLIIGFKSIAWQSLMIPPIMTKPGVVTPAGGHRHTPFMRIGTDNYCDTALTRARRYA